MPIYWRAKIINLLTLNYTLCGLSLTIKIWQNPKKASGTLQNSSRRLCRGLLQSKNFLVWTSAVINSLIYMSMGGFRRRIKGSIKVLVFHEDDGDRKLRSSGSRGQKRWSPACRGMTLLPEQASCRPRMEQNGTHYLPEKAINQQWMEQLLFSRRRICSKTTRLHILDVLQCSSFSIHTWL